MTVGIYIIRNLINGKVYVGSSVNIEKRWYQHKHSLRKGNHHSPALQNAWNKYGEEAFEFVITEEVFVTDELSKAEQELIDELKSYNPNNGYNIQAVVDRVTSFLFLEKQRERTEKKLEKQRNRRSVTVNFKLSHEDNEYIKILAAKARLSQSEFLRRLIYNYGEELVEAERATTTNEKRSRYKEMPCNWFHKPVEKSEFPNEESPIISYSQVRAKAYDWQQEAQQLPKDMGESQIKQVGYGHWTSRYESGIFERPILHVFINEDGFLTLGSRGRNESLPLASISDLQSQPEWVEAAIDMQWDVRVQEGVFQRFSEHDGRLVWVD